MKYGTRTLPDTYQAYNLLWSDYLTYDSTRDIIPFLTSQKYFRARAKGRLGM
jgi:hypothetical protein